MPAIIKPATATAQVTQAMVKAIVESGLVPDGAISLICGGAGDLLDHLDSRCGDVYRLRQHRPDPACSPEYCGKRDPVHHGSRLLNCCVLGEDVTPEQPEFALFIREIVREMTAKAGQKCTAIRRIIVPQDQIDAVSQALIARLEKVVVGDPAQEGVKMGSPVNSEQRADVQEKVDQLVAAGCPGGKADLQAAGAFYPPTLLFARSRMRPRRCTPPKRSGRWRLLCHIATQTMRCSLPARAAVARRDAGHGGSRARPPVYFWCSAGTRSHSDPQ